MLYSKKLGGVSIIEDEEHEDSESEGVDFMQIELDEDMDESEEAAFAYDAQDIEAEEIVW